MDSQDQSCSRGTILFGWVWVRVIEVGRREWEVMGGVFVVVVVVVVVVLEVVEPPPLAGHPHIGGGNRLFNISQIYFVYMILF